MGVLTKDAILAADDLAREEVTVPEWGGTIFVRMMTAAERDEWESSILDDDGKAKSVKARLANIRARLAVLTVVDASGERLFADADAEELGKKAGPALDRIFAVARRINALDQRDVDDLVKN